MTRLDFAIGGAQKCGTSSLFRWLQRHPEVGMVRGKEAHFFDDESRNWTDPDYAVLHARLPPGRRVHGDATPITLYWIPAHARLLAYNPDCRLVLLFRDPVERAASQWAMQVEKGTESLSFAQAVREGRHRVLAGTEAPGLNRHFSYVERSLYGAQLTTLLRTFSRSQVLCLDLAGLSGDPRGLLRAVTDFVGVTRDGFVDDSPIHVNAGSSRPLVDDETRDLLTGVFAEDLALFAELSGLDLAHWPTVQRLA